MVYKAKRGNVFKSQPKEQLGFLAHASLEEPQVTFLMSRRVTSREISTGYQDISIQRIWFASVKFLHEYVNHF